MVCLHLKEKGRSCENLNVSILDKDRWFEKGVKEAINSQSERSSLKRTGVLQHQLSATYNAIQRSLPKCFNLCDPSLCVCVCVCPSFASSPFPHCIHKWSRHTAAPPRFWCYRRLLPVKKVFFFPTVAKSLLIGGPLTVGVFSLLL